MLLITSLIYTSCSSDDENAETENKTVQTLTGAISTKGVDFSTSKLQCEKITFTTLTTKSATYESPAIMTLQFNDNVEVIIKGIADTRDLTESSKVYRMLKNCISPDGNITINLKDGDKIVSSESFIPTNADWWTMATDDSYFTLNFDLKGQKYSYWGQIKYVFPENPTNPTEPENPVADTRFKSLVDTVKLTRSKKLTNVHTMSKFTSGYSILSTYCDDPANFDSITVRMSYFSDFDVTFDNSWIGVNTCQSSNGFVAPQFRGLQFSISGNVVESLPYHKDNYFIVRSIDRTEKIIIWEYDIAIDGGYGRITGYTKTKYK